MSERRKWWIEQCAMMATLSYAAGFQPMGDAHYLDLLNTLITDDAVEIVWSGPLPARLRPVASAL
jgi:hypothetical protein